MNDLIDRCWHTLAVIVLSLFAISANAGDQDFTLVNQTGEDIYAVFVSPHSSANWEEDVLGQDVLLYGESVDILFSWDEWAALWDLQVQDIEGNTLTWERLNLLNVSGVVLHFDERGPWAELY